MTITDSYSDSAILTPLARLTKDLRTAATELSPDEARYLVDAYYQIQDHRKAAANQERALSASDEPNQTIAWFASAYQTLENDIKRVLDRYTDGHPIGRWMKDITGIGPVIAAGLLAHIDIIKAPSVGHIWRFAGLDPTQRWEKGQKRPWNADLKTLCWKIGESFVKVSGNDNDIYGHIYAERKALEIERNEAGAFAEQAARMLSEKRIGKDTEAYRWYSQGRLPPAHLHARAKRYAVKLFLAHLHEVWYEHEFGVPAPLPYPIAFQGHVHKIEPPGAIVLE